MESGYGNDNYEFRILRVFLFSNCREYREHVKDLSCLQRDLSRIVIIDNNPFSFLLQPLNGIPCIPFSPAQPSDNQVETSLLIMAFSNEMVHSIRYSLALCSVMCLLQLLEVLLPLLKLLALEKDVRPVLYDKFHMPEWFQVHGIP